VASAGTVHHLTLEQIKNSIREAGYIPRQRNVFYEYIEEVGAQEFEHKGPEAAVTIHQDTISLPLVSER
jgi:hypothetical protein